MSTPTMQSRSAPPLNRLTPVLVVDAVEPCIRFWIERFGLTPESEVPGEDGNLMFAIVKRGDVETMLTNGGTKEPSKTTKARP